MVNLKLLVLFVVGLALARPPIKNDGKSEKLPSAYIVVFKKNVDLTESLATVVKKFPSFKVVPKLVQVYSKVLNGFAIADASDEALEWLNKQDYIDFVDESIEWTPNTCSVSSPSGYANGNTNNWGLDRITERTYTSSYNYNPPGHGDVVKIYVVDSGIKSDHNEFNSGQVTSLSVDKSSSCSSTITSSHGTWVASVAGAQSLGTAKDADLIDVNVGCNGAVTTANVIKGFDAIVGDYTSTTKCVIVISYTTSSNQGSVSDAIDSIAQSTSCIIVAAAGNQGSTASYYPAAYSQVISVGAVNANTKLPCYSNSGSTVDIYAPGSNIWAAHGTSTNSKLAKVTGTSFAAPFVAGVAAIHLGRGESNSTVRASIIGNATTTPSITLLTSGSYSRILYVS